MSEWWDTYAGATSTESFVGTSLLRDDSVTSEKASTNLLTRAYATNLPDPSAGADLGSTGFVIFVPTVPIQIQTVRAVPLTAWTAATSGEQLVIWSSGTGGVIASWTATSTEFGETVGEPLTAATVQSTGASVAAGTKVCAALLSLDSSDNAPAHRIEIHYTTTA